MSEDMVLDIKRVTDPKEGPLDGVELDTLGAYTKFRGKGYNRKILRVEKTSFNLKASVSNGTVSISDRDRNQMISVNLMELATLLNTALRVASEKPGQPLKKE